MRLTETLARPLICPEQLSLQHIFSRAVASFTGGPLSLTLATPQFMGQQLASSYSYIFVKAFFPGRVPQVDTWTWKSYQRNNV